jgi:hypothetical protein
MTENEKQTINRAINFINRNKGNKKHSIRIANEIIEELKKVKLLFIAKEEVRSKWAESDEVEFDEWLFEQLMKPNG